MNNYRLHPALKLTRTLTGRLATTGFPVLGLPKHSEEGRKFRALVRAPEGWAIVSVDYSQIELRVAAHLSQDKGMIEVFRRGDDLHAISAHELLGAPKEKAKQDESKHRLPAKAANFGYWMGLSSKGLTEQVHKAGNLAWSKGCKGCQNYNAPHDADCDSERYFRWFDKRFPGAPRYQEQRAEHARKTGMGYGLWGEEWFLPGIWSPHDEVAEATKRQAFALPIQSGAQRLIKKAMALVKSRDLPKAKAPVEPILQVHDELLFCVWASYAAEWVGVVKKTMESIAQWSVPVIAEGKAGPTWLDVKKLK